jgi:DNA-binding MarR family transcriptional regulator
MGDAKTNLHDCLYFTASALARQLSTMADRCFRPTGLNPSQGFALMCIVEEPGTSPSVIAERLALAPSSVTRIVEALQRFGYVTTRVEGRRVMAFPSEAGRQHHERVLQAWGELHAAYSDLLGRSRGDELCRQIHEASETLRPEPD